MVDTRADRHLADRAADVSLKAWLQRTRGATIPAWSAGIDAVDLARLPRPGPDDGLYGSVRLLLLCAQWGDADAAQRLCDAAQDMCSTDTWGWRLAPLSLRKAVALWHPIVARANNIVVRLFVPVLAEIAGADTSDDGGPVCIACMCKPPMMVLEPCGHLCLCADDCQRLIDGPRRSLKCPLCRAPVEAAWRVRSLSASEEHIIDKPPTGSDAQTPPTDSRPERDDPGIADILQQFGLDMDEPAALLAAMRTLHMLNTLERLLDTSMRSGLVSRLSGGIGFTDAARDAPRRQGHTSARASVNNNDDDDTNHSDGDDDVWGDGYSYSSLGRSARDRDSADSDSDSDSTDSSSSDDDDNDDVPRLVANSDSHTELDSAPRRRGIESTGLPFTRDDIDLVASQARVSHDIAFDALLATEGNIIDAIQALC